MRSLKGLLTTRGRAFVGAGLTLAVAGVLFGYRDLTRFGVLAVALPYISALLVRTRKTRLRIERLISPDRIAVGQDAHVALTFENVSTTTTPVFLAEERLDYQLGDRPRFVVGRIPPGRLRVIDYTVRSHLRGRHQLGPLGVQVQDPFGLASRHALLEGTADLVILPQVHPLSAGRHPSTGMGSEGEQAHLIALHGEDDVTIREYRDGDDLRRIHWPATARTGDLMVRQEDRPAQRRAVVLLDPRPNAHGGSGATSSHEWAVSACASIAVHLSESGYAVHLVTPETVDSGRVGQAMQVEEMLDVLAVTQLRPQSTDDLLLRASQGLAATGGFVVAIIGPRGGEVTERLASLREPGSTGLALVLDSRSFGPVPSTPAVGATGPDEALPHVDTLRLAGWRAISIDRDDTVPHAWAVLTAGTVGSHA